MTRREKMVVVKGKEGVWEKESIVD